MTMKLTVNGKIIEIDSDSINVNKLIEEMLSDSGYRSNFVACAINREVIPRSKWMTTMLADGDEVEILGVAQGG